jgi:hypothetical protein
MNGPPIKLSRAQHDFMAELASEAFVVLLLQKFVACGATPAIAERLLKCGIPWKLTE